MSEEVDTSRLVLSIVSFLRNELTEPDLSLEDIDNIQVAIESLQSAYNLDEINGIQRRSLLDMFRQVSNPVSVKDKLRAESLKNDGNTKMGTGLYAEAEQAYSQAIELDKFNAIFYCNRAGARIKLQQYFEATADCRKALNLNPDYSKAFGRMGQAYALMDSHRRAASCFRQALELESNNETYRNNLRVAEQRVAEDPESMMDMLIQGFLSSILGGGTGGGADGMPGSNFVIVSERHTAEVSGHSPGETTPDGSEYETIQGGQTSDSDDSEDSIDSAEEIMNLRVLLGIPFVQEEDETDRVSNEDVISMQQTDNAEIKAAPKENKETSNDSGTLYKTSENENQPELSEHQRSETKEVSDSVENADGIGPVVKSDDNTSEKTKEIDSVEYADSIGPAVKSDDNASKKTEEVSDSVDYADGIGSDVKGDGNTSKETKEISDSVEYTEGIGQVVESDDNASEKTKEIDSVEYADSIGPAVKSEDNASEKTEDISDSVEYADGIEPSVKSDGSTSKKSSNESMEKGTLDETKEQSQSQDLESKDTANKNSDITSVFNLGKISSFLKNFGRSSNTKTDKSKDNSKSNKNMNMKTGTEEAAEVSENKVINKKTNDKSTGSQEK